MQTRRNFLKVLGVAAIPAALPAALQGSPEVVDSGRDLLQATQKIGPRRLGIFRVSTQLLKALMPEGWSIDLLDRIGESDYSWFHTSLLLPKNCRIDGISTHHTFCQDMVTFRVECDEFPTTEPGCIIPEIEPMYSRVDDRGVFVGWNLPLLGPGFGGPDATWPIGMSANEIRELRGREKA
jgi:hypothetical protein